MSRTTKSATEFAKATPETARRALPDYSGPASPKKFTRPQLFTMPAPRQFFEPDCRDRGTVARLTTFVCVLSCAAAVATAASWAASDWGAQHVWYEGNGWGCLVSAMKGKMQVRWESNYPKSHNTPKLGFQFLRPSMSPYALYGDLINGCQLRAFGFGIGRQDWPLMYGRPRPSPTIYRMVVWPHWAMFLAFSVPPAVWLARRIRVGRRRRAGRCRVCGYDLRASPERCPECGTAAAGGFTPRPEKGTRVMRSLARIE